MSRPRSLHTVFTVLAVLAVAWLHPAPSRGQTSLASRPGTRGASVDLRRCVGGTSDGALCDGDDACPNGSCPPYNVFHFTINLQKWDETPYDPDAQDREYLRQKTVEWSNRIYDVTEGQAVLGTVTFARNDSAPGAMIRFNEGTCGNVSDDFPSLGSVSCLASGDCAAGESCFTGLCGTVKAGRAYVRPKRCVSSAECAAPDTCGSSGYCGRNGTPPDGLVFTPQTCSSDAHCAPGDRCLPGLCGSIADDVPIPALAETGCWGNYECPAGQGCLRHPAGNFANTGQWGSENALIQCSHQCFEKPLRAAHEWSHAVFGVRDEYAGDAPNGFDDDGDGVLDECGERSGKYFCLGGSQSGAQCSDTVAGTCPGGVCRRVQCADTGGPGACGGGANAGQACHEDVDCPGGACFGDHSADDRGCLMLGFYYPDQTEYCWSGDHDQFGWTRQSRCSAGQSCWDWIDRPLGWGSVFRKPAGEPQPGPTTAPVPPQVRFATPTSRIVVLVEGSADMESRGLDAAASSAVHRLLYLLGDDPRIGILSYDDSDGKQHFPLPGPGLENLDTKAKRLAAEFAAQELGGTDWSPATGPGRLDRGLEVAIRDLDESGVGSGDPAIIWLIQLSSVPIPESQLQELIERRVPVMVSCLHPGAAPVCEKLAGATDGLVLPGSSATDLRAHAARVGHDAQFLARVHYHQNPEFPQVIFEGANVTVPLEPGLHEARFYLETDPAVNLLFFRVFLPDGTQVPESEVRVDGQLREYRIERPVPGEWRFDYALSRPLSLDFQTRREVRVRDAIVRQTGEVDYSPDDDPESALLVVDALDAGLPAAGCEVRATVKKPDGTTQEVLLPDGGRDDAQGGDGLYTTRFHDFTGGDGLYEFDVRLRCGTDAALHAEHVDPDEEESGGALSWPRRVTFGRELSLRRHVKGLPANLRPVARICRDVTAECAGPVTPLALDGTCSHDPEGQALSYDWSSSAGSFSDPGDPQPEALLPLGAHEVTLVVRDTGARASDPGRAVAVVRDTTPPAFSTEPSTGEAECPEVPAPVRPVISDACDGTPILEMTESREDGTCPDSYRLIRSWAARDASGNRSYQEDLVDVRDTRAPSLLGLPENVLVECGESLPLPGVVASDLCDPAPELALTVEMAPGGCPGDSTIVRTWTASDRCGNTVEESRTVEVRDTRPPEVLESDAVRYCLWPPNHSMVCYGLEDFDPVISDSCSEPVAWRFAGCPSDETDAGGGPDCEIRDGGATLCVRAERNGNGDGRLYDVLIVAEDACGNMGTSVRINRILVPHDREEYPGCGD